MNKPKTFCILEQGDSINRPLTLEKKAEFTTEFSDFYRLNWKCNDDPNAFVSQSDITWSEGRSLLYQKVPKDYDYYIFADEDIRFSCSQSMGGKQGVAAVIRKLLETWKPISGTFIAAEKKGSLQPSVVPDRSAFPIVGFDQQLHIFNSQFAEWMFPVLIQGSGKSMWYAQWICHHLWPDKQICFSDVEVTNEDAKPHQDNVLDQFTDPKKIVLDFNRRFVRKDHPEVPDGGRVIRKLNLDLNRLGKACSKREVEITKNRLKTYLKLNFFKQAENSKYFYRFENKDANRLNFWENCAQFANEDKHLVLTFASVGVVKVAIKWAELLKKLDIEHYVIVCMDDRSFATLRERGFNVIRIDKCFKSLWVFRLHLIGFLLETGLTVTHSDVDAFWLRNPFEAINELVEQAELSKSPPDIYFSQASIFPKPILKKRGLVVCCGFFHVVPTPNSVDLFRKIIVHSQRTGDDQVSCNVVLDGLMDEWVLASNPQRNLKTLAPDNLLRWRGNLVKTFGEMLATNANGCLIAVLPHRLFQRLTVDSESSPVVLHHVN